MKKAFKTLVMGVFACMFLLLFGGIAFRETVTNILNPLSRVSLVVDGETTGNSVQPSENTVQNDGWHVLEATESSGFISGPLVANIGELCVFRLNNPSERADWAVVPPAMCYVDSSGSSLAFASNVPAKYTIIAAIVEDGVPKILQHVCEYGTSPEPTPNPSPTPNPTPTPQPVVLGEWIKQNIPEAGLGQCAALATCYESAADAIEKNAIRTTDAAFSTLRTATQTKIKPEIWGTFLDQLAVKVTEKLANGDVKKLGAIFIEIADGLKAVTDVGDVPEDEASPSLSEVKPVAETLKLPSSTPATTRSSSPDVCPDPTGQACQPAPVPTTLLQYRRLR